MTGPCRTINRRNFWVNATLAAWPVSNHADQDVTQQLPSAFILSRFDYCNSLLSDLPWSTVHPLQSVMNAAGGVIVNLSIRDHVKPALQQLHWLPVKHRVTYKLCRLMQLIHIAKAPQYSADCISVGSASGSRYGLRSTNIVHAAKN